MKNFIWKIRAWFRDEDQSIERDLTPLAVLPRVSA